MVLTVTSQVVTVQTGHLLARIASSKKHRMFIGCGIYHEFWLTSKLDTKFMVNIPPSERLSQIIRLGQKYEITLDRHLEGILVLSP